MDTQTLSAEQIERNEMLESLAVGYQLAMCQYMSPFMSYRHNPSTAHPVGKQTAKALVRSRLVELAENHGGVHKYYALSAEGAMALAALPEQQRNRKQAPRYVSGLEVAAVLQAAGMEVHPTGMQALTGTLGLEHSGGATWVHYVAQGAMEYTHPANERGLAGYADEQERLLERAAEALRAHGLQVEVQKYAGEYAERPGVVGAATSGLLVSEYQEV